MALAIDFLFGLLLSSVIISFAWMSYIAISGVVKGFRESKVKEKESKAKADEAYYNLLLEADADFIERFQKNPETYFEICDMMALEVQDGIAGNEILKKYVWH